MDWLWKLCGLLEWIHPSADSSSRPAPEPVLHDPLNVEVEWVLTKLFRLQEWVRSSSHSIIPQRAPLHIPEKLTDDVYEVFKPAGRPSIEIVFFHGLQLEDSKSPYITTWVSRDKSEVWLLWLRENFPDARVLTISYDAFVRRTSAKGITDMYVTRENLVYSLTMNRAGIGQDGCPVVLVGHCLGGLVMKELCVQANSILGLNRPDELDECVENLLLNIKGLFFYATPHHGSRLADRGTTVGNGRLFEDVTTLNTNQERRNEDFRKLRNKYDWKTFGVGESVEVTLGNFTGVVVPEASSKHDVDRYYTITNADHFNVCRPDSRQANSFSLLSDFVARVLKEDEEQFSTKTGLLEGVIGLEGSVKIIVEKLQEVRRLAIVGMGGIGKTTLARVVFDNIMGNFEYACFLGDVKKSMADVDDVGSTDLRRKIVSRMTFKGRKVNNQFNWSKLKGKRVLLVLDDAESESQVTVMTESDGFSNESRLIVTSRNSRFLIPQEFELHWVKQLDLDHSKLLFCLHAFQKPVARRAYQERVTRFAKKCGGLPLALKVAGRYLYKQNEGSWDDAFDKLSRAQSLTGNPKDGLWSILRVTYDGLAPEEAEMFLDVAACFHGDRLEEVQILWRACGWGSADGGWQNLMDRGMVSEDEYGYIRMHEMLRDLGRSIASHTRVFGLDITKRLNNQEKQSIKVLKTRTRYSGDENVDFGVIAGLKELRILWLDVGCELDSAVPDSVCDLFPRQLACLKISGQCAALLHQICGTIRSLRSFIFWDRHAACFPSPLGLSQLSRLEHLELRYCYALRELPEEFGDLQGLRRLSLHYCRSLRGLPDSFVHLQALERLDIFHCENLRALPEEFGNLQGLRRLLIKECKALERLPGSFGKLQALEVLEFPSCEHLVIMLPCLWELGEVKELRISRCKKISGGSWYELKVIEENFWMLADLKDLATEELELMRAVEDDIGVIVRSEPLCNLNSTRDFKDVGEPDCQNDDEIFNSYCGSLSRLPEHFGRCHELPKLAIMGCSGRELPNALFRNPNVSSEHRFRFLKEIDFYNCLDLTTFPESLRQLQALEILHIYDSPCLAELPELLGQFKKLKVLTIGCWPCLTKLPESLGQLNTLEKLEINACASLEAIPKTLGQLQALKLLRISGCPLLTDLPECTWRHGALEISGCPGLKEILDLKGRET